MNKTILTIIFSFCLTLYGIGQIWEPMGAKNIYFQGLSAGHALKMHIHQDTLYIGGYFQNENGDTIKGLGKFNGASWIPILTTKEDNSIVAPNEIISLSDTLVIGGLFNSLDDDTSKKHLSYYINNSWNSFNLPPNLFVDALAIYQGKLYVSGGFTHIGNINSSLAYWSGNQWIDVGDSLLAPTEYAKIMEEHWGELYISGIFNGLSNYTIGCCIAKWDGQQWSGLADGIIYNSYTTEFEEYDNKIWFKTVGSNFTSNKLHYWDGDSIYRVGNEVIDIIGEIILYRNALYCVDNSAYLRRWNGTLWDTVSESLKDQTGVVVYDMIEYQNQLIVCGDFHSLPEDYGMVAKYVDTTTSIIEHEIKSKVKLLQQPVQSRIIIENNGADTYPVQLFSLTGQVLKSWLLQPGRNEWDISQFASGNYFLSIKGYAQQLIILNE